MAVVRVISDVYVNDGEEDKLLKELGKESDTPPDFIAHTLLADVKVKIRAFGSESHKHDTGSSGCGQCQKASGTTVYRRQS